MQIELNVKQLILDSGLARHRRGIVAATETALLDLFHDRGIPEPLLRGSAPPVILDAESITVAQTARLEVVARQIAEAIYRTLGSEAS